jgi:hypothetical protein
MRKQTFDYPVFQSVDASTSQTSPESQVNSSDKLSYHIKFSTNNSGTFDVQAKNDSADTWVSLNFGSALTLTADNEALLILTEVPFDLIRLLWTPSAGAGTMTAYIKSKAVGS